MYLGIDDDLRKTVKIRRKFSEPDLKFSQVDTKKETSAKRLSRNISFKGLKNALSPQVRKKATVSASLSFSEVGIIIYRLM